MRIKLLLGICPPTRPQNYREFYNKSNKPGRVATRPRLSNTLSARLWSGCCPREAVLPFFTAHQSATGVSERATGSTKRSAGVALLIAGLSPRPRWCHRRPPALHPAFPCSLRAFRVQRPLRVLHPMHSVERRQSALAKISTFPLSACQRVSMSAFSTRSPLFLSPHPFQHVSFSACQLFPPSPSRLQAGLRPPVLLWFAPVFRRPWNTKTH